MGSSASRSSGATRESSAVAVAASSAHIGVASHEAGDRQLATSRSVDQLDFRGACHGRVQGQANAFISRHPSVDDHNEATGSSIKSQRSQSSPWDRKCSISASRSFSNFSQSRHKLTTDFLSSENLFASHSKTYWPLPTIDRTFLPHFPLVRRTFRERYTIERLLERGAFGVVYKVRDEKDQRFALKTLSKSQIVRGGALEQVRNEVDIQTVCGHHPFIVRCIEFWQTHRKICILSEYACGGELFARITVFSVALVQLYVLEIAIALDFLHNAGIIYRDLKPENILIDRDCHVKLIDFGLSKWLKIGQRTNTICGTLQYMAPEVLSGQPYGHAVDWWALGVVACRMLTNRYPTLRSLHGDDDDTTPFLKDVPPFLTENVDMKCIIPNAIGDQEQIDPSARDLLVRLLEPNPQLRLRSLFSLERIAFYKDYSFADVRHKKVSPLSLMSAADASKASGR